jgi:hypothetical protein
VLLLGGISSMTIVPIAAVVIPLLVTGGPSVQRRALALLMVASIALLAGAGVLFARSVRSARRARFMVSPAALTLEGDVWGRRLPLATLRVAEARVVDVDEERTIAPVTRVWGTELTGYRAGWFRLRNGERALIYVTDPRRVAYVPTTSGHSVLLSVADPPAFIASLQRAAAGAMAGEVR